MPMPVKNGSPKTQNSASQIATPKSCNQNN
jgi:hypothetical protein